MGVASLAAGVPLVVLVKCEYEDRGVAHRRSGTHRARERLADRPAQVNVRALGLLLVAGDLALEIGGLGSMASFGRMSGMQPDQLVTGGAFRLGRNPENVGHRRGTPRFLGLPARGTSSI